jgi:hypothetical protein
VTSAAKGGGAGSVTEDEDQEMADDDEVYEDGDVHRAPVRNDDRRQACLESVVALFEAIDGDLAQSLVFCRCAGPHVASGGLAHIGLKSAATPAVVCEAARHAVRPACSIVELPPPSCSDVLRRCLSDEWCRFVNT